MAVVNPKCTFCDFNASVPLLASSVSSKSPLVGEVVFSIEEMENIWETFNNRVNNNTYDPRKMVMEVVSPKACAARLLKLYNYHREIWCEQYLDKQNGRPEKNYYQTINREIFESTEYYPLK